MRCKIKPPRQDPRAALLDRRQQIARYVVQPPQAIYDIGVGPKSEWWSLAAIWPDMAIFGCEPSPDIYDAVIAAGFPGPLAKVAIGQPEQLAPFYYVPGDPKLSGMLSRHPASRVCEVQVWSLDRFDREMGRPDSLLLWIDIEGSELAALESGRNLLASGRVRWINLEERRGHVPAGWCDPRDLHAFLTACGYVRVCEYNQHPTHQDVIYRHHEEPCHAEPTGPLPV